jgi:hypothetical protein
LGEICFGKENAGWKDRREGKAFEGWTDYLLFESEASAFNGRKLQKEFFDLNYRQIFPLVLGFGTGNLVKSYLQVFINTWHERSDSNAAGSVPHP